MRLLCVVVLLAAAACGPFGGAPDRGQGARAAVAGRSPGAVPSPPLPTGPAGVLLQLASASTYAVSLVFDDGRVVGPVTARLRTVAPPLVGAAPAAMPVFSASDSRLYYLDGDSDVRYLERDGTRGSAGRVAGGAHAQSSFAVSPDDRRIAVAAIDYSATPATTRLYVEDVTSGANHVDLPPTPGAYEWPVGWHGDQLVVAVGSAPTQSVSGNPYGTFGGYQLLDAATGGRLGALACNPAGPLTPAGTACLVGGTPLTVQDFAGRTRSLGSGAAPSVVSAAEAPDGRRVAFCCAAGQLQLWDLGDDAIGSLGPADSPAFGWIDGTHLLLSDGPAQHPRVLDVTTGAALPVAAALGRVVGRVPGGL
ncbi:MAG TPA: hypothetical protein VOB72_25485 [Candidatus Dormibacteraeota bacterium]|nr:hypothetical protein [Candidatus Dormibacteraeota bacterium]